MSLKLGTAENDTKCPSKEDTTTSFSSEQVLQLIQKIDRLGWIELNGKKRITSSQKEDCTNKKPICELLIIESNHCDIKDPTLLITMNQLILLMKDQLTELGGRLTIPSNTSCLIHSQSAYSPTNTLLIRMIGNPSYYPFIIQAIDRLCDEKEETSTITPSSSSSSSLFPYIQKISQQTHFDLITCEYINKIILETFELLDQEDSMGRIIITVLAKKHFKLPTDLVYTSIQKYLKGSSSTSPISGKCGYVINQGGKDGGVKQLLSPLYIHHKKQDIYKSLVSLKESTVLDLRWFHSFEWDVGSIVHYIRSICINHSRSSTKETETPKEDDSSTYTLDADIHATFDSNYLLGEALFIPRSFLRTQREKVIENYSMHGYISYRQCLVMGISKSRIKDLLLELFPDATHLNHCCVNEQHFIPQIQGHLVNCLHEGKYFELSPFLPSAFILDYTLHDDARKLVMSSIKMHDDFHSKDVERFGVLVIAGEFAIYYSMTFIESVQSKLLPLCISKFAQRRAQELSSSFLSMKDYNNRINKNEVTSKPKKIASKNKEDLKDDSISCDVISIEEIVDEISKEFLDLHEIQSSYRSTVESDDHRSVNWYDLDQGNIKQLGPLHEFCKLLNRHTLVHTCQVAIRTELEKLFALKKGVSMDGLDKASKLKIATLAFEDVSCFATSCFTLQLYSKLPLAICSGHVICNDSSLKVKLEHEFLRGPANDFIMRLTQFCLYKNGFTDLFVFTDADSNRSCDRTDHFTDPVRLGVRFFPSWSLSCSKSNEDDPLKLLRDVLPQGDALSRLWELASSQCSSSLSTLVEFLRHIEENCLLICAIPFKFLDKKCEKQLLQKRMNELQSALEISSDLDEVADLVVMILLQKIMGYVVNGKSLQRELKSLLISTGKVPEEIRTKLGNIDTHLLELRTIMKGLVKPGR